MSLRIRPLLVLVVASLAVACGGSSGVSSSARAVMFDAEDEETPRRGATCRVQARRTVVGSTMAVPDLARTRDGLALVHVVRGGARERVLRVHRLTTGLEPTGEPRDLAPGGEMPLSPRIAECGGRVLVAWQLQGSPVDSLRLAAVDSSEPPLVVAESGERPALDCAGDVGAVAWGTQERGLRDVLIRRFSTAEGLGPARRISGRTTTAIRPDVACDGDRCAVAWSDRRAVYAEVWAALVELDGDPSRVVRISAHDQTDSGAGGGYAPAVAAVADSGFLVVWHDSRSRDESEVYAAHLSGRGAAGRDVRVSRSPSSSTSVAVASCGGEVSLAAWRDLRDGPPSVVVAAIDDGGRRRSAATTVSPSADETSAPAVVCLGRDTFALAWAASDGGGEGAIQLASVSCR